jgi:predicted metalloprotease with PDZ domain
VANAADVERAIATRQPGDTVEIAFERRGQRQTARVRLVEDPAVEDVTAESIGQALTPAQQQFRSSWLGSAARNAF